MDRELTPSQFEALARVCRTNGGGVEVACKYRDGEVVPSNLVMRALFDKGLIQGKAGSYSTVVHTRPGLELFRRASLTNDAQAPTRVSEADAGRESAR